MEGPSFIFILMQPITHSRRFLCQKLQADGAIEAPRNIIKCKQYISTFILRAPYMVEDVINVPLIQNARKAI